MRIHRTFLFLIASASFLLTSCEDDDESTMPTPEAQTCSLTKATEGQQITTLTYTNDKLSSFTIGTQTATIDYNTAGKPSKVTYSGSNDEISYTYDAQGKLTFMNEAEQVEGGTSVLTTQYEYTNNQITKASYSRTFRPTSGPSTIPLPRGYTAYTYDAKGNILTVKEYTSQNSLLSTTEKSDYDDRVNPGAVLESLLGPASLNNPRTQVEKDENGNIVKEASYTNAYTYNGSGYPTKVERTDQNGSKSQVTFDYSCK
ncbi:hypothetical protein EFA69_07555 [Rufibacter immobilis]|uniref:Teneurin-like YD-shell domain-containing protein n=1 Tax=Rufibacter immobilis TaxID=1348778 RepID=A0A3M9MV78_9BACT|nr:hypothetical protein [Rufibacter immobilis]RNI29409.1 hypothetical protein EFA69_07555 [Rufibacter immobilis]